MFYGSSASIDAIPGSTSRPGIIIVGLGNPILGDDSIGWRVAEVIKNGLEAEDRFDKAVDIECYSLGGLSLMEHLVGYDRAIIIDAIQSKNGRPGQVYDLRLQDLPDYSTGHMTAAHDTSLPTALKLGREMGASLPSDITIVGIEAQRVFDFSEDLSPAVEAAIPAAVQLVLSHLEELCK